MAVAVPAGDGRTAGRLSLGVKQELALYDAALRNPITSSLILVIPSRFIGEESAFCWLRKQEIPRAMKPRFGMTILRGLVRIAACSG